MKFARNPGNMGACFNKILGPNGLTHLNTTITPTAVIAAPSKNAATAMPTTELVPKPPVVGDAVKSNLKQCLFDSVMRNLAKNILHCMTA